MRCCSLMGRSGLTALMVLAWLSTGCASLQIDVDVYKGPLAHEKEIQVKQYASLATSAKPLLAQLLDKEVLKPVVAATKPTTQDAEQSVPATLVCTRNPYRESFLNDILDLYESETEAQAAARRARHPTQDRAPNLGLSDLTANVTKAMAEPGDSADRQKKIDDTVAALNQALIFFAQKLLYVTNSELLFGESDACSEHAAPFLSVLQSLGNTILVHANDLQRQQTQSLLQTRLAASESASVQQAFRPPPSVTMDAILKRLERYEFSDTAVTTAQKNSLEKIHAEYRGYLATIASLLDAARTVNDELPPGLVVEPPEAVDTKAAAADRQAIAALYTDPAIPVAEPKPLAALNSWITRELTSKVVTSPGRPARLKNLQDYLQTEATVLDGAGVSVPGTRASTLAALKNYLDKKVKEADLNATAVLAKIAPLQQEIDAQNVEKTTEVKALAKKAGADGVKAIRATTAAVVKSVQASVVASAENIKTRDPGTVTNLLLNQLRDVARSAKAGQPSVDDTQLTIHIVETFTYAKAPCSSAEISQECRAATTVDVVDKLISSLRAQRVQAIAAGDTGTATNLLKAINVAYDQRTAMIYLRPASDYLRSVYSSNSLQQGTESEYRNMLADWFKKYLNPFENDKKNLGRKELEKIHWQNVNKVTVSGGGTTNFVLAKDDVGNWYVKAYGSDPEAIIKSATSLALFNSGKAINVNLLRRFDAQRMLDDDKTLSPERRAELNKELATPDGQGSQALLKVRDRYAERYARETVQQGGALLALVKELPATVNSKITKRSDWANVACADEAAKQIGSLDTTYLTPPSTRLSKAVAASADPANAGAVQLVEMEQSIQAVLTGMHVYSSDIPRTLKDSKDPACTEVQRLAADELRKYVRNQVATAAALRRASVERYEDALSNVLEVATAK